MKDLKGYVIWGNKPEIEMGRVGVDETLKCGFDDILSNGITGI